VLKGQLQVVSAMYHDMLGRVTPEQWVVRLFPGQNLVGFTAWHMAAVQDWVIQVGVRGIPEVRSQPPWSAERTVNALAPPFGLTSLDQADSIARGVTSAALLAYHDSVNAEIHTWLDGLSEADLDRVPDVATNGRRYASERTTDEFLVEVDDMAGRTVARHLASACIGHVRGHFGEIDLLLDLMKSRPS
jgi:hypothetical protein